MAEGTQLYHVKWAQSNLIYSPSLRQAGRSMSLSVMVSNWPWILTGALTGFVAYCNRPLDWLSPPQKVTTGKWL